MTREALVEFHYATDPRNPVRYAAGAAVPVRPEHVKGLVKAGKLVPLPGEIEAAPLALSESERAELPALDPDATDDPEQRITASTKPARKRRK